MRLSSLIAALAVAAPIGLCAGSASAQFFEGQSILGGRPHGSVYEGRWCAQENIGGGAVQEDCSFDSFEVCRRLVIQGNRGFCGQNPAFRGVANRHPARRSGASADKRSFQAAISSLIRGQLFSPSRPVSS